jgi:hypothetical protein
MRGKIGKVRNELSSIFSVSCHDGIGTNPELVTEPNLAPVCDGCSVPMSARR